MNQLSSKNTEIKNNLIKVAVLVDSLTIDYFTNDILEKINNSQNINLVAVLIQRKQKTNIKKPFQIFRNIFQILLNKGFLNLIKQIILKIISIFELRLYKKRVGSKIFKKYGKLYKIDVKDVKCLELNPIISSNGKIYSFNDSDIAKIEMLDVDLLLRYGSGIYKGEILNIGKFGIISFHHGDNRFYRGGPAGFWEVFYNEPYTGFIIQQLTNELDGGNVIKRGEFSTENYFFANQLKLITTTNIFMIYLLHYIANEKSLPEFEKKLPYTRRLYRSPDCFDLIYYIFRQTTKFIKIFISNKFKKYQNYKYEILYSLNTDWRKIVFRKMRSIVPPKDCFYADPFVFSHKGKNYIFYEDYSFHKKKGVISAITFDGDSPKLLGTVLEEDFHLSFPYVFSHDNHTYMLPESIQNKSITLYKSKNFPFDWLKCVDIFTNLEAADPMIIRHDQTFWLFCNIDSNMQSNFSQELHIFHSKELLASNWIPHKSNPVLISPRGGRNAGILFEGDEIFRVGQINTLNSYGAGFTINKIKTLTSEIYLEEKIYETSSFENNKIMSSHHLSSFENITALDIFKRH